MIPALPISLAAITPWHSGPSLFPATDDLQPALPAITQTERLGPLLRTAPLSAGEILTVEIARGGSSPGSFAEDETVCLIANIAERLTEELAKLATIPRAVIVSPNTDPFLPLPEVQAQTAQVVEILAQHGIEAWLTTRGYIRPCTMEVLAKHRTKLRVTVGMTTADRGMVRILEPLAAPPNLRLKEIVQLRQLEIPVAVEVAPLVPGLTDTRLNLCALLEALAGASVKTITAGYLFLRGNAHDRFAAILEEHGWAEKVLDEYTGGPMIPVADMAPARYLPKARRQRGYAALKALAANHGISVRIGGLSNPDFQKN